jgi:hypothetical protein
VFLSLVASIQVRQSATLMVWTPPDGIDVPRWC